MNRYFGQTAPATRPAGAPRGPARAGAAGQPQAPAQPRCPQCASQVMRVSRGFVDRVVSLFAPRHRFICGGYACRWEGTLPASVAAPADD